MDSVSALAPSGISLNLSENDQSSVFDRPDVRALLNADEVFVALAKVGARLWAIQRVGPPEHAECDLVLFTHECLPHTKKGPLVMALPVAEITEMQLWLHIARARRRWKGDAIAAD